MPYPAKSLNLIPSKWTAVRVRRVGKKVQVMLTGKAAQRKNPRSTRAELGMGGVERHGPHVSVTHQYGAYVVKRHPGHPAGHKIASAGTLTQARALAARMSRAKG